MNSLGHHSIEDPEHQLGNHVKRDSYADTLEGSVDPVEPHKSAWGVSWEVKIVTDHLGLNFNLRRPYVSSNHLIHYTELVEGKC